MLLRLARNARQLRNELHLKLESFAPKSDLASQVASLFEHGPFVARSDHQVEAALVRFYQRGLGLARPRVQLAWSLQEVNQQFDEGPRLPPRAALLWASLFASQWRLAAEVKKWDRQVAQVWDLPRTHTSVVTALWGQTLGLVSAPAPRWVYHARSGQGGLLERLAGEVLEAGIWCAWLQADRVVALLAPKVLRVDDNGRLHSSPGRPAIEWTNGQRFYAVHGRNLPEVVFVERPTLALLRQARPGEREAMLDFLGPEWLLQQAEYRLRDFDLEASGHPRRLVEVPMPDESVVLVVVTCPSTGKSSILRVPPDMKTCRQAVAWTFGFDEPSHYGPWQET